MSDRRLVMGFLICGLLSCILAALVVRATRNGGIKLYEIGPELMPLARKLHADYKAHRVMKRVRLPVHDGLELDVHVIGEFRGGAYGFAPAHNSLRHYWANGDGFQVNRYDGEDLFVAISDWYINQLEARPPARP